MRTPPWPLLVTELPPQHAEQLVERWLAEDPRLPGVSAVPDTAEAVARAWQRRTGGRWGGRRDALHALREVIEPRWPAGDLHTAVAGDRDLLVSWERAFVAEAGLIPSAVEQAERAVDRRLASGGQLVWEDEAPASTLAVSARIASTVRIGPVYTAPEHRRRGYATAAVALASSIALAEGATQCMLFTDLANPTSNKIYASIGFQRLADWQEIRFEEA